MEWNVAALLAVILLLTLAVFWRRRSSKVHGVVKEIWIYPIKSARGIQLQKAEFTSKGFLYDRLFVITNSNNRFISQRTHPKLALMETSLNKKGYLTITVPESSKKMKSIDVPLEEPPTPYEVHTVSIWSDECEGIDMGDNVAKFINEFLGTGNEMRLMRMPDSYERKTDRKYSQNNGQTAFADGYPFLILSEASVETLLERRNSTITKTDETTASIPSLSARNFRPNIVVGECQPFAEDKWKELMISDPAGKTPNVSLSVVKPCSRCKVPNIHPGTGDIPHASEQNEELYVTNMMQTYRSGDILQFYPKGEEGSTPNRWGKAVFFGQNVEPRGTSGVIHVGDVIKVQEFQQ